MGRAAGATREAAPVWLVTWEMRLASGLGISPVWLGVCALALMLAAYGVGVLWSGEIDPSGALPVEAGGYVFAALSAAYALAAGFAIHVRNAAALEEIAPLVAASGLDLRVPSGVSLRASQVTGLVGVAAAVGFIASVDEVAWQVLRLQRFSADGALSILVISLFFWLFGRVAYFTIYGTRALSRAVEEHAAIDLLEPAQLAPLGRMALRGALLWIGAALIASFSAWVTGGSPAELLAILGLLVIAVAAFASPLRGVRRRVREAKEAELRRVRTEIRTDRQAMGATDAESERAATRLPALLAYERRIEEVREWPFDSPTQLRLALYLALPIGSWLGGALVERVLGVVLD